MTKKNEQKIFSSQFLLIWITKPKFCFIGNIIKVQNPNSKIWGFEFYLKFSFWYLLAPNLVNLRQNMFVMLFDRKLFDTINFWNIYCLSNAQQFIYQKLSYKTVENPADHK
jgi:hypothetical protein